jgi:hypothetical protein
MQCRRKGAPNQPAFRAALSLQTLRLSSYLAQISALERFTPVASWASNPPTALTKLGRWRRLGPEPTSRLGERIPRHHEPTSPRPQRPLVVRPRHEPRTPSVVEISASEYNRAQPPDEGACSRNGRRKSSGHASPFNSHPPQLKAKDQERAYRTRGSDHAAMQCAKSRELVGESVLMRWRSSVAPSWPTPHVERWSLRSRPAQIIDDSRDECATPEWAGAD